jgi:hypothetical protein
MALSNRGSRGHAQPEAGGGWPLCHWQAPAAIGKLCRSVPRLAVPLGLNLPAPPDAPPMAASISA